ncbi:MAG: hypothetical protein CTY38_03080 [Methylotenera sp.]|jgi:CRISPR-associated protein Cmr3|uniref:type III-B CRISPR module-associated Cmr3 family protein n=1 Tax=Methylotenera sp. TaxID=2051956 RepID=UPI000D463818|nr:type III-B CRISPR module-associated Cmr3 family protein [Methylotenera sp.]PPC83998.1 MAG: hypothetical protein CTY38_03080 [Methylotenera sp.]
MAQQWSFSALDTLFFKESRPIESVGGSLLGSVFPPPARTMIGAIRTAIGDALQVDWQAYGAGDLKEIEKIIGSKESLGDLKFTGPYLLKGDLRLYPLPLSYLEADTKQTRLIPSKTAIRCDLGTVQLPEKQLNLAGAKPREGAFVTEKGLQQFLSGNAIDKNEIVDSTALYSTEYRLGIARDNQTRVTGVGMLYQTQHIRPSHTADVKIAMTVQGLQAAEIPVEGLIRLGAEGRIAHWQRSSSTALPAIPKPKQVQGLMLMLLSPALFSSGWCPDGFVKANDGEKDIWQGEIAGVRLNIICSVVGKPVREGGWDMVAKAPRPLASYVPAGSCYFCELADMQQDLQTLQNKLHGQQIGQEAEYGRGEIAVGYW